MASASVVVKQGNVLFQYSIDELPCALRVVGCHKQLVIENGMHAHCIRGCVQDI